MNKEEYQQYLYSKHWTNFKYGYYLVNEKKCSFCNSTENIQLHHKTYKNIGNEKHSDVIPLCRKCHIKEHKRINKNKKKINKFFRKKKKSKSWKNKPCNVGVWD